jgi:hypothetical protein
MSDETDDESSWSYWGETPEDNMDNTDSLPHEPCLTADFSEPAEKRLASREQSMSPQPIPSSGPKPRPLRMKVQDGQQAGEKCYGRVPRTGQLVVGAVPKGCKAGDRFLVMYVPTVAASALPSESSEPQALLAAEKAAEKAADLSQVLDVAELLALLHSSHWGSITPPVRPLRFQEPIRQVLFREPRKHKRRQKLSVGSVDRWKNSGGNKAVITIPIPVHLQRNHSNVLVMRHGRVLRADGSQLHYRQWSVGMLLPGGALEEPPRDAADCVIYRAFSEQQDMQVGVAAPVTIAGGTAINASGASTPPTPCPDPSWPARNFFAELDFSLLDARLAKRTFDKPRFQDEPNKKAKSSRAPFLAGLMALAVVGAISVMIQTLSGVSSKPTKQKSAPAPIECPFKCFSDGSACQSCTECDGIVAMACAPTADTHCVAWSENSNRSTFHLPQFGATFNVGPTVFVFGGVGAAAPAEESGAMQSAETDGCPMMDDALSSELWARDSEHEWRLLGGTTVHSWTGAQGPDWAGHGARRPGNAGWPLARSSAASWNIPASVSARNGLSATAAIFSGSFAKPCASRTQQVQDLLHPSDFWAYRNDTNEWTLIGGEQAWEASAIVKVLQQGYSTTLTIGADITSHITATVMWPLGRHDAQTWFHDGSLLMFSGGMDLYVRGPGALSKKGYLLNDYWRMDLSSKDSMMWHNLGGIEAGTEAIPRPQQPGPRVFGATWTTLNRTSGGDTAWLFGGIGLTFSEGGAVMGSAVAAHGDGRRSIDAALDMRSLCDLWVYATTVSDTSSDGGSPWQLVGSCATDALLLSDHGITPSIADASPAVSQMLLIEAMFATTWVDADQNLWLFGGAQCGGGELNGCARTVASGLNPPAAQSGRRRQLDVKETYTDNGMHPVVVPGGYRPGDSSLTGGTDAIVPCSNDLWMFDTTALAWTSHNQFEMVDDDDVLAHSTPGASTAGTLRPWPQNECGAAALRAPESACEGDCRLQAAVELVGGWRDGAFSSCASSGGAGSSGADCSSAAWAFGPT